jgi:hypothetical protein
MGTTEKLGEAYLKASSAIVLLVAPVLLLISILSDVVVDVLLGPSWTNTAYLLRYLPLIAILALPTIPIPSLAMTVNRMHFVTIKNMSDLASKAVLVIVLGYIAGMQGIVVAQALAATISLIVSMFIIKSMIGLSLMRQCKDGPLHHSGGVRQKLRPWLRTFHLALLPDGCNVDHRLPRRHRPDIQDDQREASCGIRSHRQAVQAQIQARRMTAREES